MGAKDLKADVHEKTSCMHSHFQLTAPEDCIYSSTAFVVMQHHRGVKVTVLPAIKGNVGEVLQPVLPLNII